MKGEDRLSKERKLSSLKEIESVTECKTPTLKELQGDNALRKILDTHIWEVIEAKNYGEGFEVRVQCSRCGLGRVTLMYNVKQSASKAIALEDARTPKCRSSFLRL